MSSPVPVPAYAVRGLSRRRGRGTAAVLANDAIDIDVPAGEIVGMLGPNGAGKTTLVRQLVGLDRPDSGQLHLLGHDLVARPQLAGQIVAYLAQEEHALDEVPVALAIETTGRLRGLTRAEARTARDVLLAELDLGGIARRPLTTLSGGQRRLAAVATALVGDRPVLVLDEPTVGLDAEARSNVWDALRRRRDGLGTTVVLVTHNVVEAEAVLDRVGVLDRGRLIACDTPANLRAQVGACVRVEVVWRDEPPGGPELRRAFADAVVDGQRWSLHVSSDRARELLSLLTKGAALDALDDVTVTAPTLEDVYLALGGTASDLERV